VLETDAANDATTPTAGFTGAVDNDGTLILRGGHIISAVSGDGATNIGDGSSYDNVDFGAGGSVAQAVNILANSTLTATGANLTGTAGIAIQEGAELDLTGGTLTRNITGYGSTPTFGALKTADGVTIKSGVAAEVATLDVTGTLNNSGTLTVNGDVTGSSTPTISGGNINLNGGTNAGSMANNEVAILLTQVLYNLSVEH